MSNIAQEPAGWKDINLPESDVTTPHKLYTELQNSNEQLYGEDIV